MPTPPRTLSTFHRFLKKIGITKFEDYIPTTANFWGLEHIKRTGRSKHKLIDFTSEVIGGWKMISDRQVGGSSLGSFTIANGVGTLEGNLVTELTEEQKSQGHVNTGFVAIKSSEFYPPLNEEHMDAIALRIKTDKRLYLCQIKKLSAWEDDLYQGLIPIPADEEVDQWRNVVIPYSKFLLTFRGYLESPNMPFDGRDIQTFGFMMAERKSGPFKFEIESISACKKAAVSARYTGLDTNITDDDDEDYRKDGRRRSTPL